MSAPESVDRASTAPIGVMHHVGIVVRDLDAAEAFVTSALGLPVVNRLTAPQIGMRAVFLACGPALVELIEYSDAGTVAARLGDRAASIDHIALQVADVDRAAEVLAAHGVDTVAPRPLELPAGRTHFTTADTSGGIAWQLLELATSGADAAVD